MKTFERRLDRLVCSLAPKGRKQFLIVLTDVRQKLGLDSSMCVQILQEAGQLDTAILSCCLALGNIPDGLNETELERYLREHGAGRRSA